MQQQRQDLGAVVERHDFGRCAPPAIWSCLARTLPSTTGLTISRCEGLAVSDR
jgi:hypothetical protein